MSTPSTSPSDFLSQLGDLLGNEVFQTFSPTVGSILQDIQANPAEWTNPATAVIKGTAAVAALTADLPTLQNTAVNGAAQLVGFLWTAVGQHIASQAAASVAAAPVPGTPVAAPAVGAEIGALGASLTAGLK